MSATGSPQGFPNISQPIAGGNGIITRPWLQLFISLWNRTGAALGGSVVPTGTVTDFAGPIDNIPDGWLSCGQAVSRSTYNMLFTVIGTTWGTGDGSSTFDLPPQNVFSKGVGSDSVGDTGGSESVTLTTGQLPTHNHPVTDPGHTHAVTDPGHTHGLTDPGHDHASVNLETNLPSTGSTNGGAQTSVTGTSTTGITINSATTGVTNQTAHTGISTGDTGTGSSVPIMPPYATFLKIIKT